VSPGKPQTGTRGGPVAGQPSWGGQGLLRRADRDLLQALGCVSGPDEPETCQLLRDLAAAIEARR
jgi:hypothetical protein